MCLPTRLRTTIVTSTGRPRSMGKTEFASSILENFGSQEQRSTTNSTLVRETIVVVFSLTFLMMAMASAQTSPRLAEPFSQYRVSPSADTKELANFSVCGDIIIPRRELETLGQFVQRIRKTVKGKRNFSGLYAVVGWSCGAGCRDSAIVNVITDRVVFLPFNVTMCRYQKAAQLDFRADSRLMVVSGKLEWAAESRRDELPRVDDCGTYYFEWRGESLRQIGPSAIPR